MYSSRRAGAADPTARALAGVANGTPYRPFCTFETVNTSSGTFEL